MPNDPKPVRIIPKENAVFSLDKHGNWLSDGEKFTNQRIIRYFHSRIKRDQDGYFLEQEHRHYIEKVYFPYEDTALFVTRIVEKDGLILCTNTGAQMTLDPEKLFIKNEDLYLQNGADRIKFTENALMAIAGYMDEEGNQLVIHIDGKRHIIPKRE